MTHHRRKGKKAKAKKGRGVPRAGRGRKGACEQCGEGPPLRVLGIHVDGKLFGKSKRLCRSCCAVKVIAIGDHMAGYPRH